MEGLPRQAMRTAVLHAHSWRDTPMQTLRVQSTNTLTAFPVMQVAGQICLDGQPVIKEDQQRVGWH